MNGRVKLMIGIYGKEDWLGFKITKENPYSIHHIFKKVYYEINDISNYALLSKHSHELLNEFEAYDRESYYQLNGLLREVNESKKPPTKEHYKKVNKILKKRR